MDEDPSHPPTGNQPAFSQAATGKDWNVAAERSHGRTITTWEDLAKEQQQVNGKIMGPPVCSVIMGNINGNISGNAELDSFRNFFLTEKPVQNTTRLT